MKLLSRDKVKFVQQTSDVNCVAACLAMVSGKSVHYVEKFVEEKLGKKPPFNSDVELFYLTHHNYYAQDVGGTPWTPFYGDAVYLLSVCSLNFKNRQHRIVVKVDEEQNYTILDPQRDRENKLFLRSRDWDTDRCNWMGPLLIFDCN